MEQPSEHGQRRLGFARVVHQAKVVFVLIDVEAFDSGAIGRQVKHRIPVAACGRSGGRILPSV